MRRACFPSVARHLSAGTARLVDMLVDKRAIPQFISSPLPDLGTKLVDLSVQFPWAMGTNGAEKLGLAGRSGGRPTSYWAASPKGVRSGPWRPRFWTTTRVGLGHFSRYGWYGRARIPLSPTTTSVSASRSRPHRARELRRRRARSPCLLASSPRFAVAFHGTPRPMHPVPRRGELETASTRTASRVSGRACEGSCARGSTSVCPCACKLGSSEPKTVAVVKAKPSPVGAPSWTGGGWVPSTAAFGYLMWRPRTKRNKLGRPVMNSSSRARASPLPFTGFASRALSPWRVVGAPRGPFALAGIPVRLLLQHGDDRCVSLWALWASPNGPGTPAHAEEVIWF